MDRAFALAARLVHTDDVLSAVHAASATLTAAPTGNAGWHPLIEPMLRVGQDRNAWGSALALPHLRRAESVYFSQQPE